MKNGTAKNIREAIEQGACIGPARECLTQIEENVFDYLSQKFCAALQTAETSQEVEAMNRLWEMIEGPERKESA